jgi:DNA-binding MarR family transcriptional regulator/GNAT superfamily N-acetyltransferase
VRTEPDAQINAIRAFNRFYTCRIGVLQEGLLDSPFTLTQARVLFELGTRKALTAGHVGDALGIDPGYLSRIIQTFAAQGLVSRTRSTEDGRRVALSLTAAGRKALHDLDRGSSKATRDMLAPLALAQRDRLLRAMRIVQEMLSPSSAATGARILVRTHQIGDIGWAIEQHGRLYSREYGWNAEFEALVATLFARFATSHDAATERCWIAEVNDERVGCVFVVRSEKHPSVAQLRCLLVDPASRGLGVGRRLVETCLTFARSAGYARVSLWTNSVLLAARRIYETTGFTLADEAQHRSFGQDLVGQVWVCDL